MSVPRRRLIGSLVAAAAFPPILSVAAKAAETEPETWRRNAITVVPSDGRPAIVLVIDDMGVAHPWTTRAAALPGPLTLSWFPFAPELPEQIAAASAFGHETMLHMPMQPLADIPSQVGPDPLRIDLPPSVNLARLRAAIAAVPGSVGLNNHTGSAATRDPELMDLMARELRQRGLLFLDSVTVSHSVARSRAELAGVPAAARDVFIDNTSDLAAINEQLAATEAFARQHGDVIAIAHPRPHTLEALENWLPRLAGKGFALWPISAMVARRNHLDPVALTG